VISEMISQLQRDLTSQQIKLPRCDRFTFGLFEKIFAEKISEAATDRTCVGKTNCAASGQREAALGGEGVLNADCTQRRSECRVATSHARGALRYPSTATE
jgi:hypothetical protein